MHKNTKNYDWQANVLKNLEQEQKTGNFKRAMSRLKEQRKQAFPDAIKWNQLQSQGKEIRERSRVKNTELLLRLTENLEKNGIRVHKNRTKESALFTIQQILNEGGVKRIVKGKSILSEELGLNEFLENNGFEVLESDLGEFIVQLAGETPSHIVLPALHKNQAQMQELLKERGVFSPLELKQIQQLPPKIAAEMLTKKVRTLFREKFFSADAGITGVNFAVSETGTLCLVENEGNGRFTTSSPRIHIAVMGIEKVIESFSDLSVLLELLTRSATGQSITSYVNFISSPKTKDEIDGPEEVHLILVDNQRSTILNRPFVKQALDCIRCSACINHCPVYLQIGGHAYSQHSVAGPIGLITVPMIHGMQKNKNILELCSMCSACTEVCPVSIPIHEIILRLREEATEPIKNRRHSSFSSSLSSSSLSSSSLSSSSFSFFYSSIYSLFYFFYSLFYDRNWLREKGLLWIWGLWSWVNRSAWLFAMLGVVLRIAIRFRIWVVFRPWMRSAKSKKIRSFTLQ